MNQIRFILILALFVAPRIELFGQNSSWESMDGPYCPETRTYLRFPDGNRGYYGTNTGTFQSTDGGKTWINVGPSLISTLDPTIIAFESPAFTVFQSPAGALFAHLTYTNTASHYVQVNVLYRSTDRGEHWEKSWGGAPTTWGGIAFGAGDTVYLSYRTYDWADGSGSSMIFRSTDAGLSWTTLRQVDGSRGWIFTNIYTQNNNLFAPRGAGQLWGFQVQRSTDAGTTWQTINADSVLTFPPGLLLRTRRDSLGFGVVSARAYAEVSEDDGVTWTQTLTADSGFASIATDDTATVLVLRNPGFELFRSMDAGQSWIALETSPTANPFTALRFYGKTHLVGTTKSGLYYRSTNYGTTWLPILDPRGKPLSGPLQSASDSLLVVADQRGNWIESEDAGETWRSVSCPYKNEEVLSLLVFPSGSLISGTMHGLSRKEAGTWLTNSIGSVPVVGLSYGSGPFLFVAARQEGRNFGTSSIAPGKILVYDTTFSQFWGYWKTEDLGACQSVYALTPRLFLAGAGGWICRSTVGDPVYPPVPLQLPNVFADGLRIGDRPSYSWSSFVKDSAYAIWAGNDSLGLYKSLDSGLTWAASNVGLENLHVLCMTVTPDGAIFVGTRGGGIFRSTDNGNNWTSAGRSGDTVQALLAGRGSIVYAGTRNGTFASNDAGTTWQDISPGLTNKDIHAIVEGPDGTVYCGTWGEGVYKLIGDIGTSSDGRVHPGMPLSFALEQNYPNPFNPRTVIRSQTPEVSNVRIVIYDLLGREVKALVNDRRAAGKYEDTFDGSGLSSGIYICRMTAGAYVQSRKMLLIK